MVQRRRLSTMVGWLIHKSQRKLGKWDSLRWNENCNAKEKGLFDVQAGGESKCGPEPFSIGNRRGPLQGYCPRLRGTQMGV